MPAVDLMRCRMLKANPKQKPKGTHRVCRTRCHSPRPQSSQHRASYFTSRNTPPSPRPPAIFLSSWHPRTLLVIRCLTLPFHFPVGQILRVVSIADIPLQYTVSLLSSSGESSHYRHSKRDAVAAVFPVMCCPT